MGVRLRKEIFEKRLRKDFLGDSFFGRMIKVEMGRREGVNCGKKEEKNVLGRENIICKIFCQRKGLCGQIIEIMGEMGEKGDQGGKQKLYYIEFVGKVK